MLKINLLAARNERESIQIAIRPKVSWGGPGGVSGIVQVQCSDLCSTSGDRLVCFYRILYKIYDLLLFYADIIVCRLNVGQSLTLRRVVPILGVPDALVPVDLPVSQISLYPGYLSDWYFSTFFAPQSTGCNKWWMSCFFWLFFWYVITSSGRLLFFGYRLTFQVLNPQDSMRERLS